MKKSTIMFVAALSLMAGAVFAGGEGRVQVKKHVISFTPNAEGRAEFKMDPAKWKELVWAYNSNCVFMGKVIGNKAKVHGGLGGVVYKFKSTTGKPMELEIIIDALFLHWGGRKITLYYSDVNNWTALSRMKGSRWAGWPGTWESNKKWQRLDSRWFWSGQKPHKHGVKGKQKPLTGSVSTTDGEFYIRVDINGTAKNIPGGSTRLTGLSWMGDVEVE